MDTALAVGRTLPDVAEKAAGVTDPLKTALVIVISTIDENHKVCLRLSARSLS